MECKACKPFKSTLKQMKKLNNELCTLKEEDELQLRLYKRQSANGEADAQTYMESLQYKQRERNKNDKSKELLVLKKRLLQKKVQFSKDCDTCSQILVQLGDFKSCTANSHRNTFQQTDTAKSATKETKKSTKERHPQEQPQVLTSDVLQVEDSDEHTETVWGVQGSECQEQAETLYISKTKTVTEHNIINNTPGATDNVSARRKPNPAVDIHSDEKTKYTDTKQPITDEPAIVMQQADADGHINKVYKCGTEMLTTAPTCTTDLNHYAKHDTANKQADTSEERRLMRSKKIPREVPRKPRKQANADGDMRRRESLTTECEYDVPGSSDYITDEEPTQTRTQNDQNYESLTTENKHVVLSSSDYIMDSPCLHHKTEVMNKCALQVKREHVVHNTEDMQNDTGRNTRIKYQNTLQEQEIRVIQDDNSEKVPRWRERLGFKAKDKVKQEPSENSRLRQENRDLKNEIKSTKAKSEKEIKCLQRELMSKKCELAKANEKIQQLQHEKALLYELNRKIKKNHEENNKLVKQLPVSRCSEPKLQCKEFSIATKLKIKAPWLVETITNLEDVVYGLFVRQLISDKQWSIFKNSRDPEDKKLQAAMYFKGVDDRGAAEVERVLRNTGHQQLAERILSDSE